MVSPCLPRLRLLRQPSHCLGGHYDGCFALAGSIGRYACLHPMAFRGSLLWFMVAPFVGYVKGRDMGHPLLGAGY